MFDPIKESKKDIKSLVPPRNSTSLTTLSDERVEEDEQSQD